MLIMLLIAVFVLAGALVFLAFVQANRLVRPKRRLVTVTPDSVGIAHWEDVTLSTRDGLKLRGWFVPPRADANGATVVCAHGTGANRVSLLFQAAILHRAGYGVLLFDFRAHGESEGSVSSFGLHEIHDLEASLEYLRSRADVHPNRIAVMGHSMGGATTLRFAARHAGARALVVFSSITSLEENLAHGVRHFTHLPAFMLMPLIIKFAEWQTRGRVAEVRPVDDLGRLGNSPLLLIYGAADVLVSPDVGRRLQRVRGHDTSLLVIDGAGHRSVLSYEYLLIYEAALLDFLATHLRGPEVLPSETTRPMAQASAVKPASATTSELAVLP